MLVLSLGWCVIVLVYGLSLWLVNGVPELGRNQKSFNSGIRDFGLFDPAKQKSIGVI